MCEYESDGHGSVFWLQVTEGSGHVSTQNGFHICPSLHLGGFFGPCPLDMGLFQTLSYMYVPSIILEIDGIISINVNFGNLLLLAYCY